MSNTSQVLDSAKIESLKETRRAKALENFGVTLSSEILTTIAAVENTIRGQGGYTTPNVSKLDPNDVEKTVNDFAQVVIAAQYNDKARAVVLAALVRRLRGEMAAFVPEAVRQATPHFDQAVKAYKEAVRNLPDLPFSPRDLAVNHGSGVVKAWEDAQAAQKVLISYANWLTRDVFQEDAFTGEQWRTLVDVDAALGARQLLGDVQQTMVGDDKMNAGLFIAAKNDLPFRLMVD